MAKVTTQIKRDYIEFKSFCITKENWNKIEDTPIERDKLFVQSTSSNAQDI